MASYDIINDLGANEGQFEVSLSPDWCVSVLRFKYPSTYSRAKGASFTTLYSEGVRVEERLDLRSEVVSLRASSTKANHLSSMMASLKPTKKFSRLIRPGDWVFAWMAQDSKTIDDVLENLARGKPANGFRDGLKFMGRVVSCRAEFAQAPEGLRIETYTLNASGFNEFDATLFYEPHLAEKIDAIGLYFAALGAHLNRLIEEGGEGISVNKALPLFFDLLLGQGIPRNLGLPSTNPALRSTEGLEAPYSFILPDEAGSIIGKTKKTKPDALAASDVIEFLYGRQEYDDEVVLIPNRTPSLTTDRRLGQLFNPAGGGKVPGNRRFTGNKMLGVFLPQPPQFSNHSVWSILTQYLNSTVNEMYTTLRVNPEGNVVPTLVARQLPFSSPLAPNDPPTTKFLSLPRWKASPSLVRRGNFGRSDAMRVNFLHVYGDDGPQTMNPVAGQIVLAPPIRDDLDVARSGLRPYMQTIANAPTDNIDGSSAKKWMAILSDIMMGQHLLLTGVLELYGVVSPICIGDNFELDGVVFHIESVTHHCVIAPDGRKSFGTTLALTHGVSANPGSTDDSIFADLIGEELENVGPAVTEG